MDARPVRLAAARPRSVPALILPVLLLYLSPGPLSGGTIRVPQDAIYIQDAVDAAQDGDEIVIDDGFYASGFDFKGKAITVRSKNGPRRCIVSWGEYVVRFQSGETSGSVLLGLTIRNSDPGAGIACENSSPTIVGNIITGNWSEYGLGAVWLHNSRAIVAGNLIVGNGAHASVGGIVCCHGASATIVNNTIVGNHSPYLDGEGGAVECDDSSTATITNCIFSDNGSRELLGCEATYSCFEHEASGTGNFQADPGFVRRDPGLQWENCDYRLAPRSPCVDAGDGAAVPANLLKDIAGNPRLSGSRVDIGAYELRPPRVLHVDLHATGAGTGERWEDAYVDLHAALDIASPGDEILISRGVYRPAKTDGERGFFFLCPSEVTVRGGFARPGDETGWTILSGDLDENDGPGFAEYDHNSFHVAVAHGPSLIEDLTIAGGNADNWDPVGVPDWAFKGGGMVCSGVDLTLKRCAFRGNRAGNEEHGWGGGIYIEALATIVDCAFEGNSAMFGGGSYGSPQLLERCNFRENSAVGDFAYGGALKASRSSLIKDCIFALNRAAGDGGAIHNLDTSEGPTLVNCLFISNEAGRNGGAMLNDETGTQIANCTFVGNVAAGRGGGLHNVGVVPSPDPTFDAMAIKNCIIWGNSDSAGTGEQSQLSGDPLAPSHSCVQGWTGDLGGEGNLGADPQFVDPVEPDYHLGPGSPCIDAGTAEGAPVTDLEGYGRPCGAGVDMGAYEAGYCPASSQVVFRRGDVDGNGRLEITDPVRLLGHLFVGKFDLICLDAADANDSGELDISDAIYSLVHQFLGGAPPARPFPDCGPDETIDALGCDWYPDC